MKCSLLISRIDTIARRCELACATAAMVLIAHRPVAAQSLAELARQEASRRQAVAGPGHVFTDADIKNPAPVMVFDNQPVAPPVPRDTVVTPADLVAATGSPTTSRSAQPAFAEPGAIVRAVVAELLLVDVRVNGRSLPGTYSAERKPDGRMVLAAVAWIDARLRPTGPSVSVGETEGGYVLDDVPGLRYEFDRSALALTITAPANAFERSAVAIDGRRGPEAVPSKPGIYLNYDLSATAAQGNGTVLGALPEAIAFNRLGSLVASGAARRVDGVQQFVRTETFWRSDFPSRMLAFTLGDAVGAASGWSVPVRFAGVHFGRDFGLAPGYISYPMPSISGSAALPSTVDLLVNQKIATSANVQAGPFELTQVPIVTGAGEMQLVIRDLLGRETVVAQPYYIAPQLLAQGLSDFSLDAGAFRQEFGTVSNDYGPLFGAFTYRRGLSRVLTGEVRAESQRDRTAVGGSFAAVLGRVGVLGMAGGYAASMATRGGHYVLSLQRTSPRFGASVSWDHADEGYRQFGARISATRPRDQLTAAGGALVSHRLNAGLSYISRETWAGDRFSLAGGSLSMSLARRTHVSLAATRQFQSHPGWTVLANLFVAFDNRRTASMSGFRALDGSTDSRVQASQSLGAGPGWGWRLQADDTPSRSAQAGVAYNGNNGQLSADVNQGLGTDAIRIGAAGSVGWLGGLRFASRRIDRGSFAVVRVGDLEGVPVALSNQIVGATNRDGRAFIPTLLPYQLNELTIDPDKLPLDVEIGSTLQRVVPYARGGVTIDFAVHRSRDLLVVLQQPNGDPVPAGALVIANPGGASSIVANRGEVYLIDVQDSTTIDVQWPSGSCRLPIVPEPSTPGVAAPRIGPLICGAAK